MAEDICLGFGDWLGHVCDEGPECLWLKQPLLGATLRNKVIPLALHSLQIELHNDSSLI